MKTIFLSIYLLGVLAFCSCKKTETQLPSPLPPMEIITEGCFSPYCTTLILVHPNDNFFFENTEKYMVEWRNDTGVLKQGTRLDCVHPGIYHVRVECLVTGQHKELTYEFFSIEEE